MAFRLRKLLPVTAILASVVALAAPQAVQAGLQVTFQEDAGPIVLVASAPSFSKASFDGFFGDFEIDFLGSSAHNKATGSDLLSSTTMIQNQDATGATHTLTIRISEGDYTLPGGPGSPLNLTSHIGGTVTKGGVGQVLTFQSYANNSNVLFDTTLPVATTGPQSPPINVTKSSFDSSPDPSAPFARTSGMYSVTTVNAITLAGAVGGDGGIINYSTSTTLESAAVPAPGGLVLALTALPALGVGGWLRRRHTNKVAG